MPRINTKVLIAGAGPVGLSVAMDLAWRGISVLVLESRAPGEPPSVKCNHVGARTMEIFRRLGVVRAVRNAGLPDDYPNDVAFRTTTTGTELSRIPIPCRAERYTATGRPRYVVADARTAAPDQPDLSRACVVRACRIDARGPHLEPDPLEVSCSKTPASSQPRTRSG